MLFRSAAAPAPAAPAPEAPAIEVPSIVKDIAELWAKAYNVQTVAYKVRRDVIRLVKDVDDAMALSGDDEAALNKIADFANQYKDKFDSIRGSIEIANAQKDAGVVASKGKRMLENETKRARQAALDESRAKGKKDARMAELQKQIDEKKQKLADIEADLSLVKEKFDAAINSGRLKQFDWRGIKRMLESAKVELKTPEGGIQLNKELKKIWAMETSQAVMVARLKDYKFAKSKLKGCTVEKVNESDIVVTRPDGRKAPPIGWTRFYREFHGNLNELINKFVRGGRSRELKKPLSHNEWFGAMIGTAYMLGYTCADDPTTAAFVEQLVKEAVVKELKLNADRLTEEEIPEQPAINEKDEDIKALLQEDRDLAAQIEEAGRNLRKSPYYREMFPAIDFGKIEEAAANEE